MKKLFMLPVCSLLLLLGSCANLGEMTQEEFDDTTNRVAVASELAGSRIAARLDDETRQNALELVSDTKEMLEEGNFGELNTNDILRSLIENYGEALGLDEESKRDIRDAALIIELFTGPIKVEVGGELDPRDQALLVAFLDGLTKGLEDL